MDRIDAIRAFLHLAEGATFAHAAHALRVRQSTISKWLARLEDELGVQLLERTTRARRLTAAGKRFADDARAIITAYDDAIRTVQSGDGTLQGRLRVSLPTVLGERLILPTLVDFLNQHPAVHAEMVFSDQYVDLLENHIDIAFRVGRPRDSTLLARTLARGRRWVVAAPNFAERHPITHPDQLSAVPCLVHAGRIAHDIWQFERDGVTRRATVRGNHVANHSGAILALAQAGQGVALLVEWLVAPALRAGRLVRLLPDWSPPAAPLQALMPPRRFRDPIALALIEHCARHLPTTLPGTKN